MAVNKTWKLLPLYDNSDPTAKTLEQEILDTLKIKKATLYAHLPAKQFPRENGFILGIKLVPEPGEIPVVQFDLSDLTSELTETELIKSSEPISKKAVSTLYELKESARIANNNVAEYYKTLKSDKTGPTNKKEVFPDWFKTRIWRKYNGDAEKVKCPVCSDSMISPESFSAGHILPESRGGIMSIENIMAICPECNSQMGSRHLYWFAWHYYGKAMWSVY